MENVAELSNKQIKAAPLQISPICSQCTLPLPLENIKGCIGVKWVKLLQKWRALQFLFGVLESFGLSYNLQVLLTN